MENLQPEPAQNGVYQTWEEICKAYPDQWVLMFEMREEPEDEDILGGVVAAHSPNRKEAGTAIPHDRPTTRGVFYTGQIRRRWCQHRRKFGEHLRGRRLFPERTGNGSRPINP